MISQLWVKAVRLVLDGDQLKIIATANAETPLCDERNCAAYDRRLGARVLPRPQHRRLDYITAFVGHLVNWEFANQNLTTTQRLAAQVPLQRDTSEREAGMPRQRLPFVTR
jgi:superoxide dismutase